MTPVMKLAEQDVSPCETSVEATPFPYYHLLTVGERPSADDLPSRIWYALKHRLDLVKECYALNSPASEKVQPTKLMMRKGPILFDGFLKLVESLGTMAKGEVYRLVLERRFLIPFIVPSVGGNLKDEVACLHVVNAMISNEGNSVTANLMTDTDIPRIAIISERPPSSSCTSDWIKNVFHIQSFHCLDVENKRNITQLSCATELGWGFLKQRSKYMPVMVLHVIGDYSLIYDFIQNFADALIVDNGNGTSQATIPKGCVLKWAFSDEDSTVDMSVPESNVVSMMLHCSNITATTAITEFLLEFMATSPRSCLESILMEKFAIDLSICTTSSKEVCQKIDFSSLRRKEFKLQQNFAQVGLLQIKLQRETNDLALCQLHDKVDEMQRQNRYQATFVEHNDLVKYFVEILQIPLSTPREMAILDLEHHLSMSCEPLSIEARRDYRRAKFQFNRVRDNGNRLACAKALEKWNLTITGIEHLWRELSHLFAADTSLYSNYPRLAAQHLLDGFSIELMDGDAAMVNGVWIKAILNQLGDMIGNARIFVLSIMGVQSCGKSTLLNYMFGVRLRTSVSRCTRGVNVQLLKCQGRKEYDYILLLDTEGIRSPEHIGEDDNIWRDNRMATLAILPSDATIILTKGESTTTISEILPIVLSVFLDSELAESISGQFPSKLYFVFNQIDIYQSKNMEVIVDTLMENLHVNAEKIEAIRANKLSVNQTDSSVVPGQTFKPSTRHLSSFQVDMSDEKVSDVRFLGTIKGSMEPPNDVPNANYGERLIDFCDYIHDRATQHTEKGKEWKAKSIVEFSTYLELVLSCINNSNFQLNFIAAHERMQYEILMQSITNLKLDMAKIYSEALDHVLQIICDDEANKVELEANSRKYEYCMRNLVQDGIVEVDGRAQKIIDDPKYAKWSQDQLIKWKKHCENQEERSRLLVKEKVQQVFYRGAEIAKYRLELQNRLKSEASKENFDMATQFPIIFQQMLDEIEQCHPPLAHDVSIQIDKVFFEYNALNPQICRILKKEQSKSKENWIVRGWNYYVSGKAQLTEFDVKKRVMNCVDNSLVNIRQFSDDVVLDCISRVKDMIATCDLSARLRDFAWCTLYSKIHRRLQEIQSNWDIENGILSNFKKCEVEMENFARNISQGFRAAELLSKTIVCWINQNLKSTVRQHLVDDVAMHLKSERWITNAEAMQALLDKSLIEKLKAKKYCDIHINLQYPKKHAKEVLSAIIKVKAAERGPEVLSQIVTILKKSLIKAAKIAEGSSHNRSFCFLRSLRGNLQRKLKLSGTSDLVRNIPCAQGLMDCDESGPEIFAIKNPLIDAMICSMDDIVWNNDEFASQYIATNIVYTMFDKSFGASEGIVPRCGEPCPRCKCPCIKAYNHDECHDTFHQPSGLVGSYWENTKELAELSCVGSVLGRRSMIVRENGEENIYPFEDFNKVYTDWSLPHLQHPLPLREYIFAHSQEELAVKYDLKVSPRVPASYYSHDLDDIERQLNCLLNGSP